MTTALTSTRRAISALALLALPAIGQAHQLGGLPHGHADAASWAGFAAATLAGWLGWRASERLVQRHRQRTVPLRTPRR